MVSSMSEAKLPSIRQTRLSKHLLLSEVEPELNAMSSTGEDRKPLVLLFGWMKAKPSQLKKYCDLYHNIGLDVLIVNGKVTHFLWPPRGYTLAEEIFEYLFRKRETSDKLLIHSFSVGAYNFTVCSSLADKKPHLYGIFRDRVVGQIFDSIVIGTYENMTEGMATAVRSRAVKMALFPLMNLYYSATRRTTRDEYDRLVSHFKEKHISVPTLFFYSENDQMCNVPTIEAMLTFWKQNSPGFDVSAKSWKVSQHTAHLKNHPQEYLEEWKRLMNKIL